MLKIAIVVGTRPNFVKITRFKTLAEKSGVQVILIHTGQHYDRSMAGVFFDQFGARPDFFLEISPAASGVRLGEMISKLSATFDTIRPDYVVAVGDVDSTLACALASNKQGCRLIHLESGLRSFDPTMPEEVNRIIVDGLADLLLVTEESGVANLRREGRSDDQIFLVGNTMIDTLVHFEAEIGQSPVVSNLQLTNAPFILTTFHRPALVDVEKGVSFLSQLLVRLSENYQVVLPLHPRTSAAMKRFEQFKKLERHPSLILTEPLGYFEFQKLIKQADLVITDSGGIQEETTFRQRPCLTLRPNTERPITITQGTNTLIKEDVTSIMHLIEEIQGNRYKKGAIPPLWDGHATERCLEVILNDYRK